MMITVAVAEDGDDELVLLHDVHKLQPAISAPQPHLWSTVHRISSQPHISSTAAAFLLIPAASSCYNQPHFRSTASSVNTINPS